VGENLIEFVPQEEGDITYTCWMGMISSTIKVVSDISKISGDTSKQTNNLTSNNDSTPKNSGGGCCTVR
jgi:plastocyanin domain-containing protein